MKKPDIYSLDAERSVIGALILDNRRYDSISDIITEQDFFVRAHQVLFQAISKLSLAGERFDVVTLEANLKDHRQVDEVGGLSVIADIAKNTPTAANIKTYANIVHKKSIQRHLQQALTDSSDLVFNNQDKDEEEVLDMVEQNVLSVKDKLTTQVSDIQSAQQVLSQVVDYIDHISQYGDSITGLPTGYIDIDKMTTGLHESELVVVAGRPSMGKTTFAINIAENVLHKTDKRVLMFSMEMPARDIMLKLCSARAKIPHSRLRSQGLKEDDWSSLTATISQLKDSKLSIVDTPNLTPTQLKHRARRFKRENPDLGLIVIDYLQLMNVPGYQNNRNLEVSEISRSLKSLAKELQIPVIALSQLSRAVDERRDKRPMMSDLRDSGAIEQDADVIMFVYRNEVYEPDNPETKGKAEIIIGKQRNGPVGSVNMTFRGELSRFESFLPDQFSHFRNKASYSTS